MLKVKTFSRLVSVILTLCLVIPGGFVVSAIGTNLLTNGGFETTVGYATYGASTVSLTTDSNYVHTGSSALKVVQGGNFAGVTIDTPMQKGKTYDYEMWVRFDAASPAATSIVVATYGKNSDNAVITHVLSSNSGTMASGDAYKKISGRLTFYEYATTGKILLFANPSTGSLNNTFYVDDIVLAEVAGAPTITSTTPSAGVTNVSPIDLQIVANFDTPMDKTTLVSANILVSGKLADGTTAINSDVKKSVLSAATNPTSVTITLFRYRLPMGSTVDVKFSGLKSAAGVAMGDFYISFKLTTSFPAAYVNHLSNPGYEDTTQYTHIMPGSVYDPSNAHTGTYAIKVTTTADWGTTMLPAYYQTNKSYYYSAWVRLDPNTVQADTAIAINMNYAKSGGTSNNTRYAKDASNNNLNFNASTPYTQIKGIFTPIDVPLGATTPNMKFDVVAINGGVGAAGVRTFLVDDVELREVNAFAFVSATPADTLSNVPTTTRTIALNFNNDIDASTLSSSIKINNSSSLIESIALDSIDKKKAIITLNADLQPATLYNINIANLKDIYTQAVTATSTFTTAGLVATDPTVVGTYPANNATNVPVNSSLTVTFDSDMNTNTFTTANIKVDGDITNIKAISKADTNKKALNISFNQLLPSTTYTVTLNNLKSLVNGSLAPQTFTFTTEASTVLPIVNLNGGYENVFDTSITAYNSTLQFVSDTKHSGMYSLRVDQTGEYGTATMPTTMQGGKSYSYSIWTKLAADRNIGQSVYFCIQYKDSTNTTIQKGVKNVAIPLEFTNLSGVCSVPIGATNVKFYMYSGSPNTASSFYIDDLEVRELPTAPAISASVPANGAVDVSKSTSTITIDFTQSVNPATLTTANININGSSSLISSVVPYANNKGCTINLNGPLAAATCVVSLVNVLDLYNQPVTGSPITFYTQNFTVKFFKNYGQSGEIEITSGDLPVGNITAVVTFTNKDGINLSGMLVFAVYAQGDLTQCEVTPVTIPSNAVNALYTVTLNVDSNVGMRDAKIIMIDDNVRPLMTFTKLQEKDFTDNKDIMSLRSQTSIGDEFYIANALRKAIRGEKVTVGFIGGSITEGAGASTPNDCYAALVKKWWADKFPAANIVYVNAGIGSTGSNIGVYRLNENLMTSQPDFVVVEYAVNDGNSASVLPYYEQLVRTIAYSDKRPGVMLMFNTTSTGTNAQPQHSQVGAYYNLPMVSFRDAVYPEISNGRFTWADLYADTIHPNNKGHILEAKFITDRLEKIYDNINSYPLTATNNTIKPIEFAPESYKDGRVLDTLDITATSNVGWTTDHIAGYSSWQYKFGPGWQTSTPNSVMSFTVTGKSIGIAYRTSNLTTSGKIYASIDGGAPIEINGYAATSGSQYPVMAQLATNISAGDHTVTFTMGSEAGKTFAILGLLVSN